MRLSTLALPLLIAASFSACKRHTAEPQSAAPAAPAETAQAAAPAATPAPAAAPAPAPAAAGKFDVNSVAVTNTALPAFPYLATPGEVKANDVDTTTDIEFDRVYVMAGDELRPVEGKVRYRKFRMDVLKWSPLAAHRNYETALKAMGATRVDKVHPANEKFVQQNGGDASAVFKKMKVPYLNATGDAEVPGFESWLIRTPKTNIWLTVVIDNGDVGLLTVEEKALQQSVQTIPAATLSTAIRNDGHVALYLNFDTDSKVLRAESLPAVDEVVKLLQGEPMLKLRVEGHTDASGDAVHNRTLSLARAESVVQALTSRQVAATRLSAVGKGPDQPLADNGTEAGKAKNRRVELVGV